MVSIQDLAAPTNEHLLGEKRTCSKFDISNTAGLARVYTQRHTYIAKSSQIITLIIYTSIFFLLCDKLIIPCSLYKKCSWNQGVKLSNNIY